MNYYQYPRINTILWAALVVFLPITSMPLVAKMVGSDAVAAPSGVFLLFMVLFWLIPYVIKGGHFSEISAPLLGFLLVAVGTTVVSHFREIPIWKENSPIRAQLQAMITLAVGLCFYLVTMTWLSDENRRITTLKIINFSGGITLVWSFAQGFSWLVWNRYPAWMWTFHELYSLGPLFRQRVVGFALEPSWLAHQLNLIFIPFWLASTVCHFSVHRIRIWKLSLENLFLAGSLVVLGMTFSRIGLLGFLLMITYLIIHSYIWLQKKIKGIFENKKQTIPGLPSKRIIISLIPILLILAYLLAIIMAGYGLTILDPRMVNLYKFDIKQSNPLLYYAKQLTVAARLVYWEAGWKVFSNHPWLGVGMGNAGFFLPGELSVESMGLTEVRQLLYRTPVLLNIKNLWIRLLAETGIVGFSIYVCWLVNLWRSSKGLLESDFPLAKTIGWMGIFAILGLALEGFSLDSFALPYSWLTFGFITSANYQKVLLVER